VSIVITDAIDIPEKIKKAGTSVTFTVLFLLVTGLGIAVGNLYAQKADTRLAVVETRLDEMDKKLDKMDAKLDRLLER